MVVEDSAAGEEEEDEEVDKEDCDWGGGGGSAAPFASVDFKLDIARLREGTGARDSVHGGI